VIRRSTVTDTNKELYDIDLLDLDRLTPLKRDDIDRRLTAVRVCGLGFG